MFSIPILKHKRKPQNPIFPFNLKRKALNEESEVSVEKALVLDPNLAEAHFARGLLLWTPARRFPHDLAVRAYRQALALNPKLDEAHHQLAMIYFHVGLFDRAEQEIEQALALNPGNSLARYPSVAELDAVSPDRPVMVVDSSGHAGAFNSAAVRAAGISAATPDPAGGKFERQADGKTLAAKAEETALNVVREQRPAFSGATADAVATPVTGTTSTWEASG